MINGSNYNSYNGSLDQTTSQFYVHKLFTNEFAKIY